jgi:hypothetical protein
MPLMPAFYRFPEHAGVVGRILAGYGELEYMLALCVGLTLGDRDRAIRTIFRLRNSGSRLDIADALVRNAYQDAGLSAEYAETKGAIRWCHGTRNGYAHCHWADDKSGLFFTDLEDAAGKTGSIEHFWRFVDLPLLNEQEKYFVYAMFCLQYIEAEYEQRTKQKKVPHPFPWPPKQQQPIRHRPPDQHIPHWLILLSHKNAISLKSLAFSIILHF